MAWTWGQEISNMDHIIPTNAKVQKYFIRNSCSWHSTLVWGVVRPVLGSFDLAKYKLPHLCKKITMNLTKNANFVYGQQAVIHLTFELGLAAASPTAFCLVPLHVIAFACVVAVVFSWPGLCSKGPVTARPKMAQAQLRLSSALAPAHWSMATGEKHPFHPSF
ncbi:hypothetical protein JB92DRAFT_2832552 [Gautieria morchelliformis]|nr:hypothetical protein JB92DRAFT_2832552 [Gautieria morchelliformis]